MFCVEIDFPITKAIIKNNNMAKQREMEAQRLVRRDPFFPCALKSRCTSLFIGGVLLLLLLSGCESQDIPETQPLTEASTPTVTVSTETTPTNTVEAPTVTATAEVVTATPTEAPTETPLAMLEPSSTAWSVNVYTYTVDAANNLLLEEHPIYTEVLNTDPNANTSCQGLNCEMLLNACDICITPDSELSLPVGQAMVIQRIVEFAEDSEIYLGIGTDDGSRVTLKNVASGQTSTVTNYMQPHSLQFSYNEGFNVTAGTYVLEVLWYNGDGIAELYLDYEVKEATVEVLPPTTAAQPSEPTTPSTEKSLTLVYQPPNDANWYALGGGNWIPNNSTVKVSNLVGFVVTGQPGGGYCGFVKPTGGTEGPAVLKQYDEVTLREPGPWQVLCKITSEQQYSDGGYIDVPFTYMEFGVANE